MIPRKTKLAVIVCILLLLTLLSLRSLWSDVHHPDFHNVIGSKQNSNNAVIAVSEVEHAEDSGSNDHTAAASSSSCRTVSSQNFLNTKSERNNLLFGRACSTALLIKEMGMLHEAVELSSITTESAFCRGKKFYLPSSCWSATQTNFLKSMLHASCLAAPNKNNDVDHQLDFLMLVDDHAKNIAVRYADEHFFASASSQGADDEELMLMTVDVRNVISNFKQAYFAAQHTKEDLANLGQKFLGNYAHRSGRNVKDNTDFSETISKIQVTVIAMSKTDNSNDVLRLRKTATQVSEFISKRFGKKLIEEPIYNIFFTASTSTTTQEMLRQISVSDIVICLTLNNNGERVVSTFHQSIQLQSRMKKLEIILNMLPGTLFVDAVIDGDNVITMPSSNSSSAKSNDNRVFLDIDSEASSSLLGIDYSYHFISSTEASQGYLLTPSDAQLHPFAGFESSAGIRNKKERVSLRKGDSVLDHVLTVSHTSSASNSENKNNNNNQNFARWFEIMKESMATLYLRKFRLRGHVREYDLRRN